MAKIKILIVEDEAVVAMEVQYTLERLGYLVVTTADTGQKAIDTAEAKKPDIILMWLNLMEVQILNLDFKWCYCFQNKY